MAERPWVTPEELKEYTEFEEVKNRADSKLKIDISRAESWVIDYCNNRFDDPEKYPEIPENVKTAVLLIAEAYAHNAVEQTKVRLKSETFDDYSYTAESSIIDVGKLGVESLLDDYVVVQPAQRRHDAVKEPLSQWLLRTSLTIVAVSTTPSRRARAPATGSPAPPSSSTPNSRTSRKSRAISECVARPSKSPSSNRRTIWTAT